MRNKVRSSILLLLLALLASPATTQEDPAAPEAGTSTERPENRLRPLPADTFNPSEEISEDFPVPFPVDI